MYELTGDERTTLRKLSSSVKIQDFLDTFAINHGISGNTCRSPRVCLRERDTQCLEGAMIAALALRLSGHRPLLLDLKSVLHDMDHVVAPFKLYGRWGAISKTNHAVLRYREPVYRTIRELALSYFHEYFLDDGKKTLRSYSRPFDLSRYDARQWMTSEDEVWFIAEALDNSPHYDIVPPRLLRSMRKADPIEIAAGKLIEWDRSGKRLFR